MSARIITGWKLDSADRAMLLARFMPLFPDVVADHVTLRTGTDAHTPLPLERSGEMVGEIDDGQGVQALVVRNAGTTERGDGSAFHLTWSLDRAAGRTAKESNTVIAALGWRSLPQAIPIRLQPARFWFKPSLASPTAVAPRADDEPFTLFRR